MLIMSYFANTRKVIAMLLHLSLPYLSFRTAPASLPLSSSQYLGSPSKSLVEPVRPSHSRALLLLRVNSISRSHPPVPVLLTRALPFQKLQSRQRLYLCCWYHSWHLGTCKTSLADIARGLLSFWAGWKEPSDWLLLNHHRPSRPISLWESLNQRFQSRPWETFRNTPWYGARFFPS